MQKYMKFIVGLLGAVLTGLSIALGDNEYVVMAISIATAIGVYGVPNEAMDEDGDGIPDFLDPDTYTDSVEPEDVEAPH